jgi:ATP-dependent DNA helicase RecQ
MISMSLNLLAPLKQYFGYDSFKPLQEAIIRDVLAGQDVVALLPTGGGKSLCYQLPAMMRPGLTLVVSPLIALMKDQVDALTAAGVPATFLNSSLDPQQATERIRGLDAGQFRLLYVAPERLMMDEFLFGIKRWNLSAIAVDEAHCISEWGHDFRPEYRMLAKVRELYPQPPILALTATATVRVRDDIANSLRLRNARRHVGSFNRPNLNYVVTEKFDPYGQLLAFVKKRKRESGIVYGLSRKTADMLADRLVADGIRAVPYHAGMEAHERSRNQEAFIRDDAHVVCATIAFGMGINKPNVRFVVHYDLPKHIEGYYQETGRAGRDGLPSQCLMLYKAGDAAKLRGFIADISDEAERQRSHQKLNEMVHFAESSGCRRAALLAYFGESWPHGDCKGCDNCLTPRETCDGTLVAQKFMSCIYRINEKSGFGTGMNHVVDVLTGSMTQKVLQWNHNELSTYGIGKDNSKSEWKAIGRELIRLGMVRQNVERYDTLELTPLGLMTLKQRTPVMLTKALTIEATEAAALRSAAPDMECDEPLFERLRELRKQLADAQGVPAYVIFSDVALRHMARQYPTDRAAFLRISGVGEKKLEDFGSAFMTAIAQYLQTNQKQTFAAPQPAERYRPKRFNTTSMETLRLFRAGQTVPQIAKTRSLVPRTIYGHLCNAIEAGETIALDQLMTADQKLAIEAALAEFGDNIHGAIERLGEGFDFGLLKVYMAVMGKTNPGTASQP